MQPPPLADSAAPLAWVAPEIGAALTVAQGVVRAGAGDGDGIDVEALRSARQQLHEAGGALHLIDLRGPALLVNGVEQVLRRWEEERPADMAAAAGTLDRALTALAAYLDRAADGAVEAPLRLYSYYRDVRELAGNGRAQPSDLLFPDLSRRPQLPPPAPPPAAELRRRRSAFEQALLALFRNGADAAAAQAVVGQLSGLEAAAKRGLARSFWWVVTGLAQAVGAGSIAVDDDVKRLLARVNLQLRRLIGGDESVAERLLVDALYYVGRAGDRLPRTAEIRALYDLADLLPADFEKPSLTAFDPALVHSLKQSLTQAKSEWTEVCAGQREPRAFAAAVELVRRDAQRLPAPPLVPICEALTVVANKLPRLPPPVRETLGVEVASALLFAELGADAPHRLDREYAERARTVLARLQAAANEKPLPEFNAWMLDLAREASDRLALGAVLAETRSALAGLEQTLDRYFRDPAAHRDELAPLDAQFAQIYGVLLTLGHDEPAAALHSVRGSVRALAEGTTAPDPAEFARIASNLGALGFFVGMLVPGQPPPAGVFQYDADRAVFSASLARPAPAVDIDSVEADLRAQLLAVQSAVGALEAAPQDNAADERLQQALTRLAATAELLDDAGLRQRVTEAQSRHAEFLATGIEVGAIGAALAPLLGMAPAAATTIVPSGHAVDRELLDTFLQEAEQVLDELDLALAELTQAPADRAALTRVRRAFHTLKGASRMVRLTSFGEAAWHVEQCCNLWLAQERPATVGLLGLAADAVAAMRGWLPGVAADPTAPLPVGSLVAQAQRVREADADVEPAPLPPVVEEVELLPLPDEDLAPAADASAAETRRIGPIEISHALYTVFINEADEHLRQLIQDIGEWRYEPQRRPAESSLRAAHSLVGVARTVGLAQVAALAAPIETLLRELSPSAEAADLAAPAAVALTPPQFDLLERGLERLRAMLHEFAAGVFPDPAPLEAAALEELGIVVATQAQLQGAQTTSAALDFTLAPALDGGDTATPEAAGEAVVPQPDTAIQPGLPPVEGGEPVAAGLPVAAVDLAEVDVAPPPGVPAAPPALEVAAAESLPTAGAAAALLDEFDPELVEVFLAESQELLPAIGADLRALGGDEASAQTAAASLRRNLHTLKGAARMAGAMQLGEVLHEMETRVGEAGSTGQLGPAADELLSRLDQAQAMVERLQGRSAPTADGTAASTAAAPASLLPVAPAQALFGAAAGEGAAGGTVVRVRADVLDRLVDQAGEVAIARSKLESEIGTLKGALTDLNDNIGRLRSQLREVEIQADAQIQARSDQVARHSADFDPLEFDRYTRLQELTRLLAESVEDAALIQNNLLKGLVTADTDLTTQSRLTRELQQQLMRVRLVPFAEIAERLHRLVRRTAKEAGKRVNLDLHGGSAEVDRGVLEKMTGAFEHLVRNAIVHGIEPAAERAAAGKPAIGQIEMTVRLQGGELVVTLADDGAGLDLPRIEALARARGLLKADARPTERELIELIFLPGFSTADTVTELAGRGVGMDVVRAELSAVGGRVAAVTERGRGTRFTLHLPATLSLARVVLARTGAVQYAIPAPIVEQVRRVRTAQATALLAAGEMDFAPVGKVPLRALAQLVGAEAHAQSAAQVPVVLLRAGDDRLAIVADEVSSAQEVVVKNVGPQVARLAGMIGATILGDGEVVLIVDPVQLLARAPQAVVPAAVVPTTEPLAPLVMVVDDSLTVRRVSQRLLQRAGYRVALAKDGVDALRQLQDVVPDAILLDIEMPRMDGFDFARNVRSDPRTRAVPIIVVTSRAADKHRGHALEAGANHFLGKPFDEDELLGLLARYVRERTLA